MNLIEMNNLYYSHYRVAREKSNNYEEFKTCFIRFVCEHHFQLHYPVKNKENFIKLCTDFDYLIEYSDLNVLLMYICKNKMSFSHRFSNKHEYHRRMLEFLTTNPTIQELVSYCL